MKWGALICDEPKIYFNCYIIEFNHFKMEYKELFDNGTDGLVAIMTDLKEVNRRIAVVFHAINGDSREIEDDSDYMEAQKSINLAIRQIGLILGNNIADKFY